MNLPPGSEPATPEPVADPDPPANWREAFARLACARFDLIRIEMADALRHASKKAALLAGAAFGAVGMWLLVLAGGIGAIAAANSWQWYWVALAVAALHLILVVVCVALATRKGPPAFPVTRAEFQKDRECIESQKTRKSDA